MTSFALPTLPTLDDPRDLLRLPRPVRAAAVDSIVNETRKKTPSSVVEQRTTPRYSIQELNESSWDQVRERFRRTKIDDRGPVARFLDLLDLPRNVIGNILAPSIARRKREEGETGTLGMGVVRTADILESLGVENKIVRGLVGFAGDVALDPLTYLGPAGWGAKLATTGGKVTAQVGKAYVKDARNAIAAIRAGGKATGRLGEYLAARGVQNADDAAKALLGGGKAPSLGKRALRALGDDLDIQGAGIADDWANIAIDTMDDATKARIKSAKSAIDYYGRAANPGIRIGKNASGKLGIEAGGRGTGEIAAGSGVLHVPFTDWGVHVPAFTPLARSGVSAQAVARAVESQGDVPVGPRMKAAQDALDNTIKPLAEGGKYLDEAQREIQRELSRLRAGDVEPLGLSDPTLRQARIADLEGQAAEYTASLREIQKAQEAAVQDVMDTIGKLSGPLGVAETPARTVQDILYLTNHVLPGLRTAVDETAARAAVTGAEAAIGKSFWDEAKPALDKITDRKLAELRAAHGAETAEAKAIFDQQLEIYKAEQNVQPPHPVLGTEPLPEFVPPAFDDDAARVRATQAAYEEYRSNVKASSLAAFDMDPTVADGRLAYADTLANLAKVQNQIENSAMATLRNTGITNRDRQLRDTAAYMIGLGEDNIGSSPFAAIDSVIESMTDGQKQGVAQAISKTARGLSEDAAHRLGQYFGNRDGNLGKLVRREARNADPALSYARQSFGVRFQREMQDVARKHNVKTDDVGQLVALLVESGNDIPAPNSPAAKALHDTLARGMFDGKIHPGLLDEAKGIAAKWGPELDELQALEIAAGLKASREPNYFPRGLSPAAEVAVAEQKSLGRLGTNQKATETASKVREDFTKQRGFRRYEWTVPDDEGNEIQMAFNDGERWINELTDDDMKILPAEERAHVEKVRNTIAAYNSMPIGTRPEGRSMTRMEIDNLAATGELPTMLGENWSGPIFSNASTSIADRFMASERFRLGAWHRDLNKQFALPVSNIKLDRSLADGSKFITDSGVEGEVRWMNLPGKGREMVIRVGDQLYRKPNLDNLSEEARKLWNPYDALYKSDKLNGWLPDQLATEAERFAGAIDSEKSAGELAKAAETITRYWKASTLLHPSWIITDVLSTLVLAMSGGINPLGIAKRIKDATKIAHYWKTGNREALERMTIEANGQTFRAIDLIKPEVQGGGTAQEALGQMLARGMVLPEAEFQLWNRNVVTNPEYRKGLLRELTERARAAAVHRLQQSRLSAVPGMERMVQAKNLVVDEVLWRNVFSPWGKLNGFANDAVRTAAFLAAIDSGRSVDDAARHIADNLLDMGTMTGFEREKLRRFLPFYSWMRASAAYGVRQLAQNPKFFTTAPHVKRAVEEAVNGDARLPEHQRPSWMRDSLAIQLGTDPDARRFALIGQMVPSEAATYFATLASSPAMGWEAFQDAVAYLGNSLNPAIKIPGELTARKEWFTGRSIGKSGDLSVGEYLSGQIRPFRELGIGTGLRKGGLEKAMERGPLDAASRLLIGGRLQPGDDGFIQSQTMRETDEIEKSLRRRIAIAEREGADSLKDRVALLKLYQRREQKGVGGENPKWGAVQVAELGR